MASKMMVLSLAKLLSCLVLPQDDCWAAIGWVIKVVEKKDY